MSILDADKEGFLRSGTSLMQTIGRAARNVSGQVHMYADRITPAMEKAVEETNRRREKQVAYNEERGIDPQPLRKKINDIVAQIARGGHRHGAVARLRIPQGQGRRGPRPPCPRSAASDQVRQGQGQGDGADGPPRGRTRRAGAGDDGADAAAAADLQFEIARDEVSEMKELRQMKEAGLRPRRRRPRQIRAVLQHRHKARPRARRQ